MAKYSERAPTMANPVFRGISYGVAAMLLSVVHVVFLRFIAVGSITPDLMLILVVWVALIEGQFTGTIAGFACGLLFDAISGDVIGTNALAKTIAGFVAGYFFKPGFGIAIIGNYRFLLIVTLAGLIHNLLYFTFYVRPMQVGFFEFVLTYGIATTLYTTVVAVFPMLVVNRR
ncbi:MAG: rod shape-determining protein MreD [Bradyrhizobiaceae bacterium]|nr:rod shape-determining protein MreD [Bradyrhizobiaceae bacterium]